MSDSELQAVGHFVWRPAVELMRLRDRLIKALAEAVNSVRHGDGPDLVAAMARIDQVEPVQEAGKPKASQSE